MTLKVCRRKVGFFGFLSKEVVQSVDMKKDFFATQTLHHWDFIKRCFKHFFFQITHCSSDRICYPGLKYACCFFLPGITTIIGGLFMFVFLERETNYQFVHSAWHVAMAVAILFLLPKSPNDPSEDEKYTILDTRPPTTTYMPPPSHTESSFKHYPEGTTWYLQLLS